MNSSLKELQQLPGVGKVIAKDLYNLGYTSIASLKGEDPELLYVMHNKFRGEVQDICMLYTFRCAVYYANTAPAKRQAEKLNWWYWMDKIKMSSKDKDAELRKKFFKK